jgi:hypothetical protein
MSSFSIDITGNVNERFNKITADIKQMVDDELLAFGFDTVAMAKQLAPADEGILRNRIAFEKTELAVEISVAVNYAAYLEFGTRSFAAIYVATLPPTWQEYAATFKGKGGGDYYDFLNNILDWVIRKGIANRYSVKTHKAIRIKLGSGSSDEDRLAETAYAIALSILRKGIKPHPYLFPAIEANIIKLKERLKAL